MTDQIATLTTEGDVSIITLNDGKANVFSPEMSSTVSNLLDQVPGDKGSLVITGRPGIFSAGFDLKIISSGDADAVAAMVKAGFTLLARIYNFPRPVIAACSGHGVALGAFLLCCADYRLGAKGQFIVQANETRNNMSIPTPILEISKSRISKTHWYRAILNAEAYPVEKAIEPGYLDEVTEPDNLMIRAMEVANDLATLGHPHYKLTKDLDQKETLKRIHDAIGKVASL
ncbi:crotonase/enoyl-CoA hydratase family protein [Gammaproteobacteria bacterium]|jgi:enoyl-CoA hydratase|nr:crotonase/enoyl-CoA hydratase family protein [Gammaproteobacteria bacterium]MDC0028407.1 crotonase/enoyl-CoA hydratase family protein [Gammaproteobacteria bacterium]MDC0979927.1 crotonase/enoyl-CoA hydratase family protein [bacterium]